VPVGLLNSGDNSMFSGKNYSYQKKSRP